MDSSTEDQERTAGQTMTCPCPEGDATPIIREVLNVCRQKGIKRLLLASGTWHFYPELAYEEYLFISNNDEGLKQIVFPISDTVEFEIDGQGSLLIFHSHILPFVFQRSSKIILRNIRIDWHRTFHSEARVIDSREEFVDLEIPPTFPYRIENEQLVFTGEGTDTFEINNALEFDPKKNETTFKVFDNYWIGRRHRATAIRPGMVRFFAKFTEPRPQIGNILALIDERRLCPAVTISKCKEVLMDNVVIHHAGGMGFITQLSQDITLKNCKVCPAPDSGRMISTRADATHFVCCSGKILIEDCEFSHQLDDPGNFHNVFTPVAHRLSDHAMIVRLQHYQQWGLEPYSKGDDIKFVKASNLYRGYQNRLANVIPLNRQTIRLEFCDPLPPEIGPGWAVDNLRWVADVTVRRTRVHSNRARGFLVTTSGKALFEENYFHSPGAAILLEGDANNWYEAGAVENLLVRRNVFENCNYGVWGEATIEINPQIQPKERPGQRFHRNIVIEENEFRTFHTDLLRAHCVDGLIFRNNTIRFTNDYPGEKHTEKLSRCEHCSAINIANNKIA